MPWIGHIVYGLCFIIPLFFFTKDDDKPFNYKVAFIFLANNLVGPDAAHIWVGLPFHNLLGFLIFAIPLSLFYSYFSRFSLIKSEGIFPLKLEDDRIREVNWKNAYCLTVAGGISHFFIDQFYHFEKEMFIWRGWSITHDEMLAWGGPAYHVVDPFMLIGYILILGAILFSLYAFKKGWKETTKMFLIVIGLFMVIVLAFGIEAFGGERDIGVLVHCIVYVFIPLFLLFYAARDVSENPITSLEVPKISRDLLVKIAGLVSLLIALFFLTLSLIGIITPETIAKIIASALGEEVEGHINTVILLGVIILIISTILLIGSIGLFFKSNICRYLVISVFTILIILAFPFIIVLFLCEHDVKEMFKQPEQKSDRKE